MEDLFVRRRAADSNRRFDEVRFTSVVKCAEPKGEARQANKKALAYSVLVHTEQGARTALRFGLKEIYFDVCGFAGDPKADLPQLAAQMRGRRGNLVPYLPQIILPREESAYLSQIKDWQAAEAIEGVVVNNLGHIAFLRSNGWEKKIYAGSGLNIFNSAACRFMADLGLSRAMLSPEMTLPQLQHLNKAGLETELFAQGALQLMVSEYCVLGAACGHRSKDEKGESPCQRPCQHMQDVYLCDEKGYRFPIRSDHACRMHVFNSREHCLLEDLPVLKEAGVDRLLLDMRLYDPKQAETVLRLYKDAATDSFAFEEAKRRLPSVIKEYTKGHLYRGV